MNWVWRVENWNKQVVGLRKRVGIAASIALLRQSAQFTLWIFSIVGDSQPPTWHQCLYARLYFQFGCDRFPPAAPTRRDSCRSLSSGCPTSRGRRPLHVGKCDSPNRGCPNSLPSQIFGCGSGWLGYHPAPGRHWDGRHPRVRERGLSFRLWAGCHAAGTLWSGLMRFRARWGAAIRGAASLPAGLFHDDSGLARCPLWPAAGWWMAEGTPRRVRR